MTTAVERIEQRTGKTRVLSIQLGAIGNKVYSESLRSALAGSTSIDLVSKWSNDDRELHSRIIDQLLRVRSPLPLLRRNNVDFRRVRAELGYAYKARRLLQRMVPTGKYDVLHFHTQTLTFLATDFIRRTPTVVTADQTAFQIALETDPAWRWTHLPSERLESRSLRAATFVVTWSRWAADSMIEEHGLSPERVRVIPAGYDSRRLSDLSAFAVPKSDRRKRILFVGGDYVRKGGPLLVDVFLKRFADGDVELHLATAARDVPKHPDIFVHRNVTAYSTAWKELYANADVFAVPTYSEPFGIAFVEAMAAGLPVIGTDVCAGREITAVGETGYLIQRGNGRELGRYLEELLSREDLRKRLGDNGAERARRLFDAEKNMEALAGVFREASSVNPHTRSAGAAASASP